MRLLTPKDSKPGAGGSTMASCPESRASAAKRNAASSGVTSGFKTMGTFCCKIPILSDPGKPFGTFQS